MKVQRSSPVRGVLGALAVVLLASSPTFGYPLYSVTDYGLANLAPVTFYLQNRAKIDDAGNISVAPWGAPGSDYKGPLPPEMESIPGGFARDAVVYSQAGGNVAGWGIETAPGRSWRGFAVIDGTPYRLGDPSQVSLAFGINESGQVVGVDKGGGFVFSPSTGTQHLVDAPDIMTGTTPHPWAINKSGQIVGEYMLGSRATHAFFKDNGADPIDLNSALAPNSGWTLVSAEGINAAGQIAAFGVDAQGKTHALRLDLTGTIDTPTPVPTTVPEPTTLALLGLVSAGLLLRQSPARRAGRTGRADGPTFAR